MPSVNKTSTLLMTLLGLLLVTAGCSGGGDTAETTTTQAATGAAEAAATTAPAGWQGELIETMDAGAYTYVHVDTGTEQIWAAGPKVEGFAVGQKVTVPTGMVMPDFHSKTLDRTFPVIHFVEAFWHQGQEPDWYLAGAAPGSGGGMGGHDGMTMAGHGTGETSGQMPTGQTLAQPISGTRLLLENAHVETVAKVAGGYTVAEIYAQRNDLAEQTVQVRGRVVKFTPNIMGTNWVHIQDGTGEGEAYDLTVTTSSHLDVGDVVLVSGPLSVDRDFGAGYRYTVIVEGASVVRESR